jgi:hypothetical protein
MSTRPAQDYWDDWGLLLLWLTVLSGPFAWALNQLIGYALVKPVCFADAPFALTAIAFGALAITAWGAWTAWSLFLRLRDANPKGGRREDRRQMMALGGVSLNLLLGLLILTSAVSPFFLSPCE